MNNEPPGEDRRAIVASGTAILGAIGLSSLVLVLVSPTVPRLVAAITATGLLAHHLLRRTVSGPSLAFLGSLVVLAATDGGFVPESPELAWGSVPWTSMAAVAAYPLLGSGLLQLAVRYRLLRRSDLVVEAVLIGAAAAIVVQAAVDWRTPADAPGHTLVGSGLPALLVGMDVALVIVASWSLHNPAARTGPPAVLAGSLVALTGSHAISALHVTGSTTNGLAADGLLTVALLGVAGATGHLVVVAPPDIRPHEAPLFSLSHTIVVVVALLAAPVVLVVQTLSGVTVSATVAVGTALSGLVLANYVVDLLRERAAGEHSATHDALTGLPNRVLFMDRVERAIAHARRSDLPVAVLYLDLDGFKDVNDTLGHDAGDQLLRVTAERLLGCSRAEDTVARLAGDEFAVLLPHLHTPDDAVLVGERMLEALGETTPLGGHQLRNPASIGVAVFPRDGDNPADIVAAADDAMYRAKEHPGPKLELSSGRSTVHADRLETETALHTAIARDQLVLHYQPIFDADGKTIVGAEALVRWNHPEKGLLPPGQFVPVAERSDLIVLLGAWVLRTACAEQAQWSRLGFGDLHISVNVSSRQFDESLVSTVASALRTTGANPRRIVLEVTESAAVDDLQVVAAGLEELADLGLGAAVDDFGTGYSSLQYLGDLPVSMLKIDKSFVQAMTPRSAAIVAATIAMGHSLGMTIVAEGVETAEQQRFLQHHGCDRLQGYHLGKPVPVEEFLARLVGQETTPVTPATVPERTPVAIEAG